MNLHDITITYNIQKNIISDILLTQNHEKADQQPRTSMAGIFNPQHTI